MAVAERVVVLALRIDHASQPPLELEAEPLVQVIRGRIVGVHARRSLSGSAALQRSNAVPSQWPRRHSRGRWYSERTATPYLRCRSAGRSRADRCCRYLAVRRFDDPEVAVVGWVLSSRSSQPNAAAFFQRHRRPARSPGGGTVSTSRFHSKNTTASVGSTARRRMWDPCHSVHVGSRKGLPESLRTPEVLVCNRTIRTARSCSVKTYVVGRSKAAGSATDCWLSAPFI